MTSIYKSVNRDAAMAELDRLSSVLQEIEDRRVLSTAKSKIGVWEWDLTCDKLIWDEAMYNIYDAVDSGSETAYADWANSVHPDDLPDAEKAIKDCLELVHLDFSSCFRVKHRTKWRIIVAQGFKKFDEDGKVISVYGINHLIPEEIERFFCVPAIKDQE